MATVYHMRRQRVRMLTDAELVAMAVRILVDELIAPYGDDVGPKDHDRVMRELSRRGLVRRLATLDGE